MKFYDDRQLETEHYEEYNFPGSGFRSDETSLYAVFLAAIIIIGVVGLTLYALLASFFN